VYNHDSDDKTKINILHLSSPSDMPTFIT